MNKAQRNSELQAVTQSRKTPFSTFDFIQSFSHGIQTNPPSPQAFGLLLLLLLLLALHEDFIKLHYIFSLLLQLLLNQLTFHCSGI